MLQFEIANLYRPDPDATNFVDGEVIAVPATQERGRVSKPLCNQKEAEVHVSVWDEDAMKALRPFRSRLRAWLKTSYGNFLTFDGIITQPELDSESMTIRIPAVDHSLRAMHHFVRLGDTAHEFALPLVGESIGILFDAAQNTTDASEGPSQADRYPPLGIDYGTDESWFGNPSPGITFERGEQVWEAILQFVGIQTAPEFELIPVDNVPGVYESLYTTARVGLHDPINDLWIPNQTEAWNYLDQAMSGVLTDVPVMDGQFQVGWGLDNAHIKYRPGGILRSHIHVLADSKGEADEARRVTEANTSTAEEYGVYVGWEQTNFKSADDENLRNRGRQQLAAYSVPPEFFDLVLKQDCDYQYMKDFLLGTVVEASWHLGTLRYDDIRGRIMEVRLYQDDEYTEKHRTEVTVQPHYALVPSDEES